MIYNGSNDPPGFGNPTLDPQDLQTDRMVIVQYPAGAGGKFLMNCLGISNGAVLQDSELAEQQLKGNLNLEDKVNLLLERIQNTQKSWQDLGLGCLTLFGVLNTISDTEWVYPELAYHQQWNPVIKEIIENNCYMFTVTHIARTTKWNKEIWPNAKVIVFTNTDSFFEKYRSNFNRLPELAKTSQSVDIWNKMKQPDWPDLPPKWIENFDLSPFVEIKQEIEQHKKYNELVKQLPSKQYFDQVKQLENKKTQEMLQQPEFADHFIWDTDWYLDSDVFLDKVNELYNFLELEDYNRDLLAKIHTEYLSTLKNVQNYIYQN